MKKVCRRARTLTEGPHPASELLINIPNCTPVQPLLQLSFRYPELQGKSTDIFAATPSEGVAFDDFATAAITHMMLRSRCHTDTSPLIADLSTYLEALGGGTTVEKSSLAYLEVMDKIADRKETMLDVLTTFQVTLKVGEAVSHLIVTGDAKTYCHIQTLKQEYGNQLFWVLPFIGDWHLMKNYQEVLMHLYYDAGLKHLAMAAGFRAETLTHLQRCSNFQHAHHFLIQAWEAMFQHLFQLFIQSLHKTESVVLEPLNSLLHKIDDTDMFRCELAMRQGDLQALQLKFHSFVVSQKSTNANWKFWSGFLFTDCLAYMALHHAIRSSNWELRMSSIKLMTPLFFAADRPTYSKLLSQHIADCLTYPTTILGYLRCGGFTVSITGRSWHSVAVDEAHEMLVNKDLKQAIVRPSREYLTRLATFFPYRSQALHNLQEQLFPESQVYPHSPTLVLSRPEEKKYLNNLEAMRSKIEQISLFTDGIHLLHNPFVNKNASPAQENDLLRFREVGQKEFEVYVQYHILKQSSICPKSKRKALQTFAEKGVTKQRYNTLEKEKKLVSKCLKQRLVWCQTNQLKPPTAEQYIDLPRALAKADGMSHKGNKSVITTVLENRYKGQVVFNTFPQGWIPDIVILEGMFIIHTTPLPSHSNMLNYTMFLLQRFVAPYSQLNIAEIHIVFDDPERLKNHPKAIERVRRDPASIPQHDHLYFSDDSQVPRKWHKIVLACRYCKRNLVEYLGSAMLQGAMSILSGRQRLIVAGNSNGILRDTAWYSNHCNDSLPAFNIFSNAEEGDTRVWLHAGKSNARKILIFSPDTDTYHIGMTASSVNLITREVMIQINPTTKPLRLLSLHGLADAVSRDPDMFDIPHEERLATLQSLYVLTGCDFTSFFAQISKSFFATTFFRFAAFICANTERLPGSLAVIITQESSFLAFLRLVGVVYFLKNLPAFRNQFESPIACYQSYTTQSEAPSQQHFAWIKMLNAKIWERVDFEDSLIPSIEALRLHWMRSRWVLLYWRQAQCTHIQLPPLEKYGWKIKEQSLVVEWDTEENIKSIQSRVALLLRGCGCKKGCETRQCSCKRVGNECGPGCRCVNCHNRPPEPTILSEDDDSEPLDCREMESESED